MALLRFEGFEEATLDLRYWGSNTSRVAGRAGGSAMAVSSTGNYFDVLGIVTTSPTVTVGKALNLSALSIAGTFIGFFRLYTSEGLQLQLRFQETVTELVRGDSTVIATGERITAGAWRYIEMQATFDAAQGNVTVRVDGKEIIAFTGPTLAVGTSTALTRVQSGNGNSMFYVDDFYLLDASGTEHNSFLGDIKVHRLLPNGNGVTNQWVGSDGNSVDNYLLVNESPANSGTYVHSSTIGQRDLYAMADLPAGDVSQVLAVRAYAMVGKDDAGAASFRHLIRNTAGTITSSGLEAAPQAMAAFHGPIYTLNPSGAAWTATEINGVQAGIEAA